jgi:hypothetical protein
MHTAGEVVPTCVWRKSPTHIIESYLIELLVLVKLEAKWLS